MKAGRLFSVCIVLLGIYYARGYLMDGLTTSKVNSTLQPTGHTSTYIGQNHSQLTPTIDETEVVPPTIQTALQSPTPSTVCENTIETCHQYGRTACTEQVYEAWARKHCALYCGFCTDVPKQQFCQNKINNCAEFDSGHLCTDGEYYSWAYENCRGYCQFDMCNDSWCEDSKDTNCPLLDLAINICADVSKAKTICRKHCHLCNVTDGKWCSWNAWSTCDVTCDNGTQVRRRQCQCPSSNNGGAPCDGVDMDTRSCAMESCPVHGGWSRWSEWGTCSASFGIGLRRRERHCDNPHPSRFGDHCFGENVLYDVCSKGMCTGGNWTSWGVWGSCSVTCGTGMKRRERNCTSNNPFLQTCVGDTFQNDICVRTQCDVVNGGWTTWTSWSSCSTDCEKHRTRSCTNPSPSLTGQLCLGSSEDKTNCDIASCATAPLYVRLSGGTSSHNGRLEVSLDGSHWGTVCDDDFNSGAAQVVCRMLGYTGSVVKTDGPGGTGPIYLDNVVCTGYESSLMYCKHNRWSVNDCGHGEDVGVVCN